MAHTAIVSREYGLPAVVGTGFATQRIKTGDLIEVNGDEGVVTLL
jgi:pyruvate,water dikinase